MFNPIGYHAKSQGLQLTDGLLRCLSISKDTGKLQYLLSNFTTVTLDQRAAAGGLSR
jgi:hypothetical protein